MPEEESKAHNKFLNILVISSLVVINVCFYVFYYQKDYDFIVETQCDPAKETCFYRDCSIDGECPPNNLSYYNSYTIKAKDFKTCENEDCTQVCTTKQIECVKTECTEDDITSGACMLPEVPEAPIPVIKEVKKK